MAERASELQVVPKYKEQLIFMPLHHRLQTMGISGVHIFTFIGRDI